MLCSGAVPMHIILISEGVSQTERNISLGRLTLCIDSYYTSRVWKTAMLDEGTQAYEGEERVHTSMLQ